MLHRRGQQLEFWRFNAQVKFFFGEDVKINRKIVPLVPIIIFKRAQQPLRTVLVGIDRQRRLAAFQTQRHQQQGNSPGVVRMEVGRDDIGQPIGVQSGLQQP